MRNSYKPIKPMKEVPDQLRKLRRQFLRYQQAEIVYSLSHKKLFELASDAGAIYRFDSTVLINRDIFDAYLERFHEPATTHKNTAAEYICGCALCSVAHCCVDWIWRDNISPDLTWVILSAITLAVCLADMSASPLRPYPA